MDAKQAGVEEDNERQTPLPTNTNPGIHRVVYTVTARVRRWGNSYGVRLTKGDLQRLGVRDGGQVDVVPVQTQKRAFELSDLPTFTDSDPFLSIHHDDVLYGRDVPKTAGRKKK